jgi:ribosomal protein L7/L12
MSDRIPTPSSFCFNCGTPLRPGARFCPACGARLPIPQPDPPAASQTILPASIVPAIQSLPPEPATPIEAAGQPPVQPVEVLAQSPVTVDPVPPAEPAPPPEPVAEPQNAAPTSQGLQIRLEAVPPQARGRTLLALRQVIGLSPQDAGAFIDAAPVLLAIGLSAEMADTLQAALANAGALVSLHEAQEETARPAEPAPEPHRRISSADETVRRVSLRSGLRTVTGLDLGQTNTYLAYARADREQMAAAPEMIKFEAQAAIPSAVSLLGGAGEAHIIGAEALKAWVQAPESVRFGLLPRPGDDGPQTPLCAFLESLADRLNRVLMPGALSIAEGATTNLGVPSDWDQPRIDRLVETATQAGFPINRVAPRALAILAHHKQQGALRVETRQETSMVIDWGGTALAVSFVEHGGDLPRPRVIEHIEHGLGGAWFDEKICQEAANQLEQDLSESDERAMRIFASRFKEAISRAYAEGKKSCAQYCVIPTGAPPKRVVVEREAFEKLAAQGLEEFRQALADDVEAIGLKPDHLENIILAGGGAHWYFAREAARDVLHRTPLVGAHPEEACARGLAIYRLGLPGGL